MSDSTDHKNSKSEEVPPAAYSCVRISTLMMCFFTNLFIMMNKGLFALSVSSIMQYFDLDKESVGYLATSYTIGHLLASVTFGACYNKCKPMILLVNISLTPKPSNLLLYTHISVFIFASIVYNLDSMKNNTHLLGIWFNILVYLRGWRGSFPNL